MRKRPLCGTTLEVTELGLGTWGLSGDGYGPVRESEQDRVIDRALAMGIRLFDTADCYAEGAMERRLGQRLPRDGSTIVVTKIGTRRDQSPPCKDFSAEYLREAFERSRERLERDSVDCVLLHNPSAKTFHRKDAPQLLEELRAAGQLRVWGASVGTIEAARAAITEGAQVIELAYNLFHTRELLDLMADGTASQVGIVARSVLAHGLLSGLWPPTKEFPSGDHRSERWSSDELKRRVQQLNAVRTLLSDETPTLRSIALRFALANEQLSSIVLGPRNSLQLDQLVREAGKAPPYVAADRLDALRERLITVGVTS